MSNANLEFLTQAFLRHGKEAFDMLWKRDTAEWIEKYYYQEPNCDTVDEFESQGLIVEIEGEFGCYSLTDKAIALIKEKSDAE